MTISDVNTAPDAFDLASRVTRRSASNLWFVGQALGREKRRAFEASYATMRVIDDFVDDDFLARPAAVREATRGEALDRIADWISRAEGAIAGQGDLPPEQDETDRLFPALRLTIGRSDLDAAPWRALGEAMRFDVEERPLRNWQDFEEYCTGATVAPAAIFLYVLQAEVTAEGRLKAGLSSPALMDQARDMAVFCYLVHILRDFGKDAARGGQLLTLPEEAFATQGLSRAQVEREPTKAMPILRDLVIRAGDCRRAARAMADRLKPELRSVEAGILESLLTIYERIHDDLIRDPAPSRDRSGLVANLRASLVRKLGLEPV